MVSTSTFSHPFHSLLCILLSLSLYSSAILIPDENLRLSSTANLPKIQAEKLIRELNLFPKGGANVGIHDSSVSAQKIVEKRFKLPVLADSGASVEELGHHAGYYRLPHSQAASKSVNLSKVQEFISRSPKLNPSTAREIKRQHK